MTLRSTFGELGQFVYRFKSRDKKLISTSLIALNLEVQSNVGVTDVEN